MNAAARLARGEWLLFLHADTQLPKGAIYRLIGLEDNVAYQAGGFRHCFSGSDWRLKMISRLDNIRAGLTRIIYGDQAIFVRRSLFELLGGFPQHPALEDLLFCKKLKRVTRPLILDQCVVTDSRKFVQMGIWRRRGRQPAAGFTPLPDNFALPGSSYPFFAAQIFCRHPLKRNGFGHLTP